MYDSSRFFVMTSDYCSEFISISDGTEAVKPLHDKYLMQGKNNANSNEKIDFVSPGGQNLSLSANEIIEKARNSQNRVRCSGISCIGYLCRYGNLKVTPVLLSLSAVPIWQVESGFFPNR